MALLYLIRHGRAAAAWDQDPDPGLAPEGRQQAQAAVEAMRPHGPLPLVVSPMARTRETAQPFAAAWQVEPRIDTRIREIPSPAGLELGQRGAWLRQVAAMEWPALDSMLQEWRQALLAALLEARQDTVFITHFMVINAAVSAATADPRVVSFRPDYCSVTVLRNEDGRLRLIELGTEAKTRVL